MTDREEQLKQIKEPQKKLNTELVAIRDTRLKLDAAEYTESVARQNTTTLRNDLNGASKRFDEAAAQLQKLHASMGAGQ